MATGQDDNALATLRARLIDLHTMAGSPTIFEMSKRASIPEVEVDELLNGGGVPSWPTVSAFVTAGTELADVDPEMKAEIRRLYDSIGVTPAAIEGRIRVGGRDAGAGFAIARRFVVTADYVVGSGSDKISYVSGRDRIRVTGVMKIDHSGVALLELESDAPAMPQVGRPQVGMSFRVQNQPRRGHPTLSGRITNTSVRYTTTDGREMQAIQLMVDQTLGSFAGYGGAAVIAGTVIVGMIIDQAPSGRSGPTSATNVLHAVPLTDVLQLIPPSDAPAVASAGERYAGYSTDTGEVDLLDIGDDVDTLATIIAATKTSPPLAIGIFGSWGSGKSFFMRRLHDRVSSLASASRHALTSQPPRPSFYCSRVVQITFNAWHYTEANLWASLASRIFEGLADFVRVNETNPDETYRHLLSRLATSQAMLTEAEQRRDTAVAALKSAELQRREHGRGTARTIQQLVSEHPELGEAAIRLRDELGLEQATTNMSEIRRTVAELHGILPRIRRGWTLLRARGRLSQAGAAALLAMGAGAAIFLLIWLVRNNQPLAASVASVVALLTGLTGAVKLVLGETRDALRAAEQFLSVEASDADEAVARADDEVERARERVAQLEAELAKLRAAAPSSIHQFVDERYTSADYRRHLGVVALIQRDFQALSRLLAGPSTAPGLPDIDRIVLFIDDLDRCRPAQVVQVLQALNLILAFPLFVVVVGVDSRWLVRSIEREYETLMSQGDADLASTPQGYLEKIFQIPLWLRPLQPSGFGRLIRGLAEDARAVDEPRQPPPDIEPAPVPDAAPEVTPIGVVPGLGEQVDLTPRSLALTDSEISFLAELAPLISTPRTAKRLVNLYRLIKVGASEEEVGRLESDEHQAVLTLLAIMVSVPDAWHGIARALLTTTTTGWSKFVESLKPEQQRMCEALEEIQQDLKLEDLAPFRRWVGPVSRFSFGHA